MLDLLAEGSRIAVLGMGVVFAILILMVGAVRGMSGIARRFEHAVPASPASLGPTTRTHAETVAVVTAAIALHRRRRKG